MMRRFSLLLALSCSAACGNPAAFQGIYSGNYNGGYNITKPQVSNQPVFGTGNVTIVPGSAHDLIVDLNQLIPGCQMPTDVTGPSSFTGVRGTACTIRMEGTTNLTLTSGTGNLNGNALTISFGGDLNAMVQGQALSGTFVFTYAGQKL